MKSAQGGRHGRGRAGKILGVTGDERKRRQEAGCGAAGWQRGVVEDGGKPWKVKERADGRWSVEDGCVQPRPRVTRGGCIGGPRKPEWKERRKERRVAVPPPRAAVAATVVLPLRVYVEIADGAPHAAACSRWKCKTATSLGIKWLNKIQLNPPSLAYNGPDRGVLAVVQRIC